MEEFADAKFDKKVLDHDADDDVDGRDPEHQVAERVDWGQQKLKTRLEVSKNENKLQ